jgi:importin subunit alpha-1
MSAIRNKQEERKENFKKIGAVEDLRRRRDSDTMQLRKSKREESLMKRRNANASPVPAHRIGAALSATNATPATSTTPVAPNQDNCAAALTILSSEAMTQELLARFNGNDITAALQSTMQIRRMLSVEKDPPIQRVLALGVLERLVLYVSLGAVVPGQQMPAEQAQLAFEASWAITNIASGHSDETKAVANAGAVPVFVNLLATADEAVRCCFLLFFEFCFFFFNDPFFFFALPQLRDQCVWALGNIAGDGPVLRDLCLSENVMQALLYQFSLEPSQGLVRNTTWAISNLCRGKPAPKFDSVAMCLDALAFLVRSTDRATLADALWALSYLTDGDDSKIEAVIAHPGVCEAVVRLLSHADTSVKTPALRVVGNIVTGNAKQTQAIIDLQPFGALAELLRSSKKSLAKEACWALSNIAAGDYGQIQSLIDANLIPLLVEKMNSGEFDVKKEACWAVSNATTNSVALTRQFADRATVQALVNMSACNDTKIVLVALEAIEHILKAGEPDGKTITGADNVFAEYVEDAGGLQVLEDLQDHQNNSVYNQAVAILETYFGGEEARPDENLAPNQKQVMVAQPAQFAFGLSNTNQPRGSFAF